MIQSIVSILTLGCVFAVAISDTFAVDTDWTMQLTVDGRKLEGKLLTTVGDEGFLLGRDGRLNPFEMDAAKDYARVSDNFRPYSANEMRGRLLHEFGRGFEVSCAGHYVVVHPRGERNRWTSRFGELYRSFMHFFSVRGAAPQHPEFPLVAVVLPSQTEFLRHARAGGANVGPGVLGYYSPTTNRILMYDTSGGADASSKDWFVNAETIIHEATHQTAFNTGIHNRFAPQPRWAVEGLGTLFEAPGVWNSGKFPNRSDRINSYRLAAFKRREASRPKGVLAELVASDRLFQVHPDAAYAEAWTLTFFLMETQPRRFVEYLSLLSARPPIKPYKAPQRLADFISIFGSDLDLLEARMLRFMQQVK